MTTIIGAGNLVPHNLLPTLPSSNRRSSFSTAAIPSSSAAPFFSTSNNTFFSQLKASIQNPNSSSSKPSFNKFSVPLDSPSALAALAALAVGSGIVFHLLSVAGGGFGNSGGGSFSGGGGGGGGGGGNFWSKLQSFFVANAKEDESPEWDQHGLSANVVVQLNRLSALKKYKVSDVTFVDKLTSESVGNDNSFHDMISITPGGIYTKAQLQRELDALASSGRFDRVHLESKTKPDGTIGIGISFVESTWQGANSFKCINVGLMESMRNQEEYKMRMAKARPCMLPQSAQSEIVNMLEEEPQVTARLLQRVQDKVLKWYHDNGYVYANVVNFGNLNTKELVCEVVEGDITKVSVQFLDKLGNLCEGNTQHGVVKREIPKCLQQGKVFNEVEGRKALNNIDSLGLFSNIWINPRADEKIDGGIVVEINLNELDQKSAEVSTEWSIVPGCGGRPTLASIQPGGTVSFEHRNIKGLNRSLHGSVTTSNFLNPQDELAFKLEYVHPYLDGLNSSRNRTLLTSCFNSRKLSPVFTGGPGADDIPPVWVDRAGIKTNITENLTRQSKFSYGVVMEEITTRDESSHICSNGQRVLPNGVLRADGPPTTLSGTGVDRMAFLQANLTRDNTKFVNGALVGERNVFQLDQGLFIGSKFPFFNRHQLTCTKFLPLKTVEEGAGKPPPPTLVLHGHYGGCVGDLPSYDAFTLGGPYSVRGYNMGEIGAARNVLEVAAELRIPIKNTQVYAFAEHGTDLGSSKDVKGNPTEVYRRMGKGSSYGAGVKLGLVRAEYAIDHNSKTGAVFFRFGERF